MRVHSRQVMIRLLLVLLIAAVVAIPSQAQEKLIPVTVSLGDVSMNKLIFIVAKDNGIYKKDGLEVQQWITPGAAAVVRRSGVDVPARFIHPGSGANADITIGGGCPLIVGLTTNALAVDRVIIASTDNKVRWHIISRSDIKSPEDLKGKRLGYSSYGSMTNYMAIVFAKEMGWDPNHDLSLMSKALNVEALRRGRVDAFVADELARTMALAAGYKDLVDLSKYHVPIAGSGVNASRAWLKTHHEAARRFIKATVDAIALLKENKQAAFDAMAKWYNIKDPSKQEGIYSQVSAIARKPYPAVAGIKKAMEIFNYHEMSIHKPSDFYDDSFVRVLDKSGYIDSLYK